MIRINRIYNIQTTTFDRKRGAVENLFRRIFVREAEEAAQLLRSFTRQYELHLQPYLYLAENGRGQPIGLALALLHRPSKIAYLDYIGSDPEQRHLGIGSSLYEVLRDGLRQANCRGMVLEVPPDEPELLAAPERLATNQKRLSFYEALGARPLADLPWDNPGRQDYDQPLLVWDSLGSGKLPKPATLLEALAAFLSYKYPTDVRGELGTTLRGYLLEHKLALRPARYATPAAPVATAVDQQSIAIAYAAGHAIHHVRARGFAERPVRVKAIRDALVNASLRVVETRKFPESTLRQVHSAHYLKFIKDSVANMADDASVYPQVFPVRRPDKKPRELTMRLGYYCSDTFTPLSRGAYEAARSSFDTALTAATQVAAGQPVAYAVCRPPGHHAERSLYGGFCYFNNAAGAAQQLSARGKVAVLDIDYHHGNGTQDIFYDRQDVFTVSIHGHPAEHYPYFSGYEDETGSAAAAGFNLNFAERQILGDDRYLKLLRSALKEIRKFDADYLVVALGLDIMKGDPTGNFGISAAGMQRIGRELRATGLPLCIVQEGGYRLRNLQAGIRAFILGLH